MEKKQQDYNEFQITPTHTWKYMKHNMKGTVQSIIKSALLNIFKISSEESIQTAPAKVWKFSRVFPHPGRASDYGLRGARRRYVKPSRLQRSATTTVARPPRKPCNVQCAMCSQPRRSEGPKK